MYWTRIRTKYSFLHESRTFIDLQYESVYNSDVISPSPKDDLVIRQFLDRIHPLRDRIEKIVLFGSRARGQAAPWSDYDVMIVVHEREQGLVDRLYDAVVQVLCSTEKELSLK